MSIAVEGRSGRKTCARWQRSVRVIDQHIHDSCGARRIRRGLCRLTIEPNNTEVNRECHRADQEESQAKQCKQHYLSRFMSPSTLFPESSSPHSITYSYSLRHAPQFAILPSAAAFKV